QEIVDGGKLERFDGETAEGGDEYDRRRIRAERFGDVEAAQGRHLDVEERNVGSSGANELERGAAVLRRADDFHVGHLGKTAGKPADRQRLVVRNHDLDGFAHARSNGKRTSNS